MKAAVRAAAYEGAADERAWCASTATLEVEVLARLAADPARLRAAPASRRRERGRRARSARSRPAATGYELLLEDPGRRTLELELRIAATREGDRHTARVLAARRCPCRGSRCAVPGLGDRGGGRAPPRVDHAAYGRGRDRARRVPRARAQRRASRGASSVDEGPQVEPLVFADERHDVRADRGVLRCELVADLSVLRAPLGEVRVTVPADVVTLYVQGDGIRTWERSDDGTSIDVVAARARAGDVAAPARARATAARAAGRRRRCRSRPSRASSARPASCAC